MKLKTYMKKHGISVSGMSRLLGISRQSVYNVLNKRHSPNIKTILKIESVTAKEVMMRDL